VQRYSLRLITKRKQKIGLSLLFLSIRKLKLQPERIILLSLLERFLNVVFNHCPARQTGFVSGPGTCLSSQERPPMWTLYKKGFLFVPNFRLLELSQSSNHVNDGRPIAALPFSGPLLPLGSPSPPLPPSLPARCPPFLPQYIFAYNYFFSSAFYKS